MELSSYMPLDSALKYVVSTSSLTPLQHRRTRISARFNPAEQVNLPVTAPSLTPPATTQHLREDELRSILDAAKAGRVTVVAAPPASGKSTAAREAVLSMHRERQLVGEPFRVLWATHGTVKEGSLGEEALEEFDGAASMVKGYPHFKGKTRGRWTYAQQFLDWPDNLPVKIISHAHLSWLLAPGVKGLALKLISQADLLIVDEDPLFSLIRSSPSEKHPLTLTQLRAWPEKHKPPFLSALQVVMERARDEEFPPESVKDFRELISQDIRRSLTGNMFWRMLRTAMGFRLPDWDALKRACERHSPLLSHGVLDMLRQDYTDEMFSGSDSHRFGLVWNPKQPGDIHFRFDVLPRLNLSVPIVVLDAYASEPRYQAVFSQEAVEVINRWPHVPLDIEWSTEPHHDRYNLTSGKTPLRRQYIFEQIGEVTTSAQGQQKALVLSYQRVVRSLKKNAAEINPLPPDPDAVEFTHWFAGRGVNNWKGRHVFALHAPGRPEEFEYHRLAALAPLDAEQRKTFAEQLAQDELLQMLHRGRQTLWPPGDPDRPRIVLTFKPRLPDGTARLQQYVPTRPYVPHSTKPHWTGALKTVVNELLTVYQGVPRSALVATKFLRPSKASFWSALAEEVARRIKADTRRMTKKAPHLYGWGKDDTILQKELGPYTPNTRVDTVEKVMTALGLQGFLVELSKDWRTATVKTEVVYARSEEDAQNAMEKLGIGSKTTR